jgi:hypothetical protein
VDLADARHHICAFSKLRSVRLMDAEGIVTSTLFIGNVFRLCISFELFEDIRNLEIGWCINNIQGVTLVGYVSPWEGFQTRFDKGVHEVECTVPFLQTLPGTYYVTVWVKRMGEKIDDEVERAIEFEVLSRDLNGSVTYFDKYAELNMFQHSSWRQINSIMP